MKKHLVIVGFDDSIADQDSLFTAQLPLVQTNEELDVVKRVFPKLDVCFIASGCIADRKDRFEKLWESFSPYADSNFKMEIQQNFHSRSWEMYMGHVLLSKKLLSDKSLKIKPENEGPDFILDDGTYVECIAPSKGDPGKDSSVVAPVYTKTSKEIVLQKVPVDKMILRITQAFKDKAKLQYEGWKTKEWFNGESPFVVAINSGDLEWPQDYMGIPLVIRAIFGVEFLKISKDHEESFSCRAEIQKGAGVAVPVNYFTGEDFNFVSGVIFSDQYVLNHPEKIGDDCVFVNNPFGKNPVTDAVSNSFHSWFAEKDKLTKKY